MTLKIVGAGLGRTGTMSLKIALEQLGFAPCHHMVEVFARPDSVPLWIDAAEGRPDWDAIFKEFRAAVDYPSCKYWRQLAACYPDAKVILTLRDPDDWFDSTQATIFAPESLALRAPPPLDRFFGTLLAEVATEIHDRAFMTDHFLRHADEVQRTIPKERLIVLETGEGWERLCQFLDVPVPETPYPGVNTREEFRARVQAMQAAGDH